MSLNQSRSDKSEAQLRKPGRSGSSGQQRSFSGGGGKGGGGTAHPPSSSSNSSSSLSSNRSFRRPGNGQGGQSRVNAASTNSEPNISVNRAVQNGTHVQPPLHVSNAPVPSVPSKATDSSSSRGTGIAPAPKSPSSQTAPGAVDSNVSTTPVKADVPRAFPLQFGSISPGFMNVMQIPARTSSAPPNLDEQKRDQARHDSLRTTSSVPIPSVPKQQLRKDVGSVNPSKYGESHPPSQVKRDVHAQVPSAPSSATTQKPSVLSMTGMPMATPFQQQQVPVQFGGPNPQVQPQGVSSTSLQMQVPLPVGNTNQVQQQVFVPGLQSHPLQPQGMLHQAQGLTFTQMGHQLAPPLSSMGIGITPPFAQQQAGKFGGPRKAVKITHPETHEELRLDKRTDSYLDGGPSGSRSHPNVTPQSQPIPSFNPAHPLNYYPTMPPNSYNPIFFPAQTSLPLTSSQMTAGSPATRYNYSVVQGPQTVPFMNASSLNPMSTKIGPPVQNTAEPTNLEHADTSAQLAPVQVILKPATGLPGEKFGLSTASVVSPVVSIGESPKFSVASPVVSKGESPKLLRPTGDTTSFRPQGDSDIGSESSTRYSKSLPEAAKHPSSSSVNVSVQRPASSAPAAAPDESVSIMTNIEGRRKEAVRRLDSLKDHQKKQSKKDAQHSQPHNQADASDFVSSSMSFSSKLSEEVDQHTEDMQSPPSEVVGSSISILNSASLGLEDCTLISDGVSDTAEGKEFSALSETFGDPLQTVHEQVPGNHVACNDVSEAMTSSVRTGEGLTCKPSNASGVGTISDNLDTACHAEQDGSALQEIGKTEVPVKAKQGGCNFEPSVQSTSESVEATKHTELKDSGLKDTNVGSELGSKTEHELKEEAASHVSEVGRTTDDLLQTSATSSDSTYDESTTSVASSTFSHENTNSILNAPSTRGERMGSQNDSAMESDISQQETAPIPTPVSSEVASKLERKGVENSSGGPLSAVVSGSKDRLALELNRVKSNARGKKKRREILKIADAAGTTSDLYMAYKGPEEKQEPVISSESIDSTSSVGEKQVLASDDTGKDVIENEEDGQSKTEPDDWEDAADISTPKLKTSDDGKHVRGGFMHRDEDGSEVIGKKKYSRDFLLTFVEQCKDLPMGFEIGSDIADAVMSAPVGIAHIVDRESYSGSGRIIDRPAGGPRSDRRGSGMVDDDKWNKSPGPFTAGRDMRLDIGLGGVVGNFRPAQGGMHGVLRNPRGHPSAQYVGGILSGPMQSLTPQGGMQRNSLDADRWQRTTGIQKGLIPSPQTPLQVMHKAQKKYEVGKVSDEKENKQRQLKAILNKLTPQNFEKLFKQVKEVNIDNAVTLRGVISQIFDKALMEPTFCEMYANFCFHLAGELPDFSEDNEKVTFKRSLLNKCQEEFERGEREQAEADRVEEEGEIKQSEEEREEKRIRARRRMLGNIRLIGELYKKRMLTERIMHECIQKLLGQHQNPDEEDVEALCKLMSTIGEMIDHAKAKEHMDAYFDMMTQLSTNMKLSSRVRFMLKDAIDLRKNKWQQRRKVEGPKKIEEVHRDAAQERQAQGRLARGGSGISSSARRGQPMDYGSRGSPLSSPNTQMGGFRGLPLQSRGYGAQDVRLEDKHPYESRTLSVPLPQRQMDDDSITLGPQGGLARGMSIRGQPLISNVPVADILPSPGDSKRLGPGPNGYGPVSEWTNYNSREELIPRNIPDRFMGPPSYDQSSSQERNSYFGNRDLRPIDRYLDRSTTSSPATQMQGSSAASQNITSEKVWPEERLRDMSIAAIREFYSAKDEKEVSLCIKDLNAPSFYPSMISIWVTDSFERKDMDRDLLAKLLVNLTRPRDGLLTQQHLVKGFESVLSTLEDYIPDAPKAAEFLGRILAKVIIENIVPLREVGRLVHEGGEEPGRLLEIGLASEVLGNTLESIKLEKGEGLLDEILTSSNLRLEDFRPPSPIKSSKLDAFL
ncbi:PREDICTED: eukaryotic translation initiation factor 4G-like isoform X3 [Nelumbo nucifera]|uniref:Eukaryotic translation initiation factor 4G n=1 Tax=Nelumbo nucifera TaxID=4432 RepID=A0A1U8B1Q4_NELNU|nr:PREDICTED: eukaryotic translation initiation factor 4G-like isoform X3 [Nelumbo nucifera]